MFGISDGTTYTIQSGTCDHCKDTVVILTFTRTVIKTLGVNQTFTLQLHRPEAVDFARSIQDATVISNLEEQF